MKIKSRIIYKNNKFIPQVAVGFWDCLFNNFYSLTEKNNEYYRGFGPIRRVTTDEARSDIENTNN